MILLDVIDVLPDLHDDQREIVLNALISELSHYSNYAIYEAQLSWDSSRPYEDFIKY